MGRTEPTVVVPPNHNRRMERARRAKDTVNRAIPDILRASPRARHGIHKADLIVDPPANNLVSASNTPISPSPPSRDAPKVRILCQDTLSAAARMSSRPFAVRRNSSVARPSANQPCNIAILNMASPLRPGGGFLEGANSQEEFLCARTTLYPSLWDSFYRLPEIGGVWTPDVMVFRDHNVEANDLTKRDRYFIDVISSGMLRFSDTQGTQRVRSDDRSDGGACSCGVSYCDRDRELVTRKMKAVLRIAERQGVERLILGAWGCGAYGNPVREVAKIWRKVIAGSPRQRRPNPERWSSIKEIVFAIPDRTMMREFENVFRDVLCHDPPTPTAEEEAQARSEGPVNGTASEDDQITELISKIAETEMAIEQTTNARSKARLREVLGNLNRDLSRGLSAKQFKEEDLTNEADEESDDDYVVAGMSGSDGEENSFYNFDENDVASDSSDCAASEVYDFRTHQADGEGALPSSAKFDAETGWYSGSIDQFHSYMRGNGTQVSSHASPQSPGLEPDQNAALGFDGEKLNEYLEKYASDEAAA